MLTGMCLFFALVSEKLSPRSYTERLHNLIPNIVRNLASNPKQIYLFVRDERRTSSQTNEAQRRKKQYIFFKMDFAKGGKFNTERFKTIAEYSLPQHLQ